MANTSNALRPCTYFPEVKVVKLVILVGPDVLYATKFVTCSVGPSCVTWRSAMAFIDCHELWLSVGTEGWVNYIYCCILVFARHSYYHVLALLLASEHCYCYFSMFSFMNCNLILNPGVINLGTRCRSCSLMLCIVISRIGRHEQL